MTQALFHSALSGLLLASVTIGFSGAAFCLEPKPATAAAPAPVFGLKPAEPKAPAQAPADNKPQMSDIQKFCLNNAASAGDAKAAWQAAKLMELEAQIKQRIAELDAKRAEYEEWLKKRDEALKKAEDGVVAIYTRMRPDAAASQLSAMDDMMAATLLTKLPPRNASLILNEIEPGRAARLTNTMTGTGLSPDGKKL